MTPVDTQRHNNFLGVGKTSIRRIRRSKHLANRKRAEDQIDANCPPHKEGAKHCWLNLDVAPRRPTRKRGPGKLGPLHTGTSLPQRRPRSQRNGLNCTICGGMSSLFFRNVKMSGKKSTCLPRVPGAPPHNDARISASSAKAADFPRLPAISTGIPAA